ncbi:hypothetical protein Tco_1508283 [Tanacetum coccineum]
MLPSTGRVSSTNASGSKPKSNTKNDRIPQPSSRSMKNKVEAHHKKFKSSANKNSHVLDCNANDKNVALSKNSDTICLSCNECLFSANHDACVVQYLKKCKKCKVAKSAKQKVKSEWKPTGRIFKTVGLKWIPTAIMGYGDLQMGNILISCVYYVEGLGHNQFSVGQFCDSDLEVAFRKHTSSKPPSAVNLTLNSCANLPPPDTTEASSSTSIDKDAPSPSTSPNIEATNSPINSTNVETNEEVAVFDSDTFTNPFSPPETSSAESSSRIVDTSKMHTFQ